jgi:peptidyl-prolyl cis-trans isomerase NIMA-interacting 1
VRRLLAPLVLLSVLAAAATARAEEEGEWAARHVLIAYRGAERSTATRSKEEAHAIAQRIAADAMAPGADFESIARASSDCPSRASGGSLGVFRRGQMTPKFEQAVAALKEGEVSGVVETPFGFHVIQRIKKPERAVVIVGLFPWKGLRAPSELPVPLTPSERSKEAALEDATRAMEHLRGGGTFDSLPPQLIASPLRPGWQPLTFTAGGLRPVLKPVEDASFGLAVGETSKPVETVLGYAVVRRLPWYRSHLQHLLVSYRGSARADPSVKRTKEEARARAIEALGKYEADRTAWRRIVAEYSDEPDAAAREGDLGAAEPGQFVPEFDAAVSHLKVGEHTKVFETAFGYHVARRVE